MNVIAETAATKQLRKCENIERASLGCRVRKIFHRIHEAERRGSIALVEIARNERARPATNSGQYGHILFVVRAAPGCRLPNNSG